MSFQQTLQTIESSQLFKNFKQNYPDAQLCAGFFILDFLSNDTKKTLDYKTDNKVITFTLHKNNDITIQEDKLMDIPNTPKLTPINLPSILGVELDELKGLAGTQALDNGISSKFHKIIAILQNYKDSEIPELKEQKLIWNLTCMLDQLIILHILIDAESSKILKFERKSMMDMVKKR